MITPILNRTMPLASPPQKGHGRSFWVSVIWWPLVGAKSCACFRLVLSRLSCFEHSNHTSSQMFIQPSPVHSGGGSFIALLSMPHLQHLQTFRRGVPAVGVMVYGDGERMRCAVSQSRGANSVAGGSGHKPAGSGLARTNFRDVVKPLATTLSPAHCKPLPHTVDRWWPSRHERSG